MNQLPFRFESRPSYAADDFLVSDANREAYDWVMNPAGWNSYGLRLSGPHRSGRTHLAHLWAAHHAAAFLTQPVTDVTSNTVLDDIGSFQEADVFHLLNLVKASGKMILLTCSDAPLAKQVSLPDLLSRLNALPEARLHLPDDTLIEALLRKQLADRQLLVPDEVIHYLLPRIDRSFTSVSQMVATLDEQALKQKKPITVPLVKNILSILKS